MNIIEFRLCDEDRARLDRIITALEGQAPRFVAGVDLAKGPDFTAELKSEEVCIGLPVEGAAHLEPPVAAPAAPIADPAPVEPAPTPEVKPVSLGEFQKAIVTRCAESPVMKAKVQALVHRYAASVSTIPEDKRSEVLAELANL